MRNIKKAIGKHRTDITIGDNLDNNIADVLKHSKDQNQFIVSESVVPRFRELIRKLSLKEPIILKSQECVKSIETYTNVINICFERSLNRSSRIIAIGGGNIGDFAGFLAATYRRGIDFVYIPTTLLSQCDVILNKVAINMHGTKNLIGAFYTPSYVFCETTCLKTQPKLNIDFGMSEIVKHSLIRKSRLSKLLDVYLHENKKREDYDWEELIYESLKVKIALSQNDYFDNKGLSVGLNYGHTFAHALEDYSERLFPHGLAVSLGMKLAGDVSCILNLLNHNQHLYHNKLLNLTQLDLKIPSELEIDRFVQLLKRDNRNASSVDLILLKSIGSYSVYSDIENNLIRGVILKNR